MPSKAAQTTEFIVATVAPIFNKYGYAATSMSDITKATKLTKGAIYGNFKNKEELALAAFNYSIKRIVTAIEKHQSKGKSPLEKLYLLIDFYRTYYNYSDTYGGCPILNIGVDANHQMIQLHQRIQYVINKLQQAIANFIEAGKTTNEIKKEVDASHYASLFFSMIEGAVFMTFTMQDEQYLTRTMDHIDTLIKKELSN
ncbi:TetR/AcrR family transcriptional regulator [Aquimarina rhabdastrellae]